MATTTKRGAHDIHPSRQNLLPRDKPSNSRKRQKPDNLSGSKSFKKARPINDLKTSIRNLRRLLDRAPDATTGKEALPPKIRIAKERELASAQHELAESQAAEARSKMIARYHKVRFFDRQKATKRLKRARKAMKEVEDDAGERERLALEADECELDVQYAMYYPLDVAYVALYPSVRKVEGKEEEEDVKVEVQRQGDAKMRALLKKCAGEGKLDALRNGKLDMDGNYKIVEEIKDEDEQPKSKKKAEKSKEATGSKRKAETIEPEASGDESDGGFFE